MLLGVAFEVKNRSKKGQAISLYGSDRDRGLQIRKWTPKGVFAGIKPKDRPAKLTGSGVDPSGRRIGGYRLNVNPATTP
jgi:hypothetical protein